MDHSGESRSNHSSWIGSKTERYFLSNPLTKWSREESSAETFCNGHATNISVDNCVEAFMRQPSQEYHVDHCLLCCRHALSRHAHHASFRPHGSEIGKMPLLCAVLVSGVGLGGLPFALCDVLDSRIHRPARRISEYLPTRRDRTTCRVTPPPTRYASPRI